MCYFSHTFFHNPTYIANVLLNRSVFGKYNVRTFNIYFEANSQCLRDDVVHKVEIFSFGAIPQSVYSENRAIDVIGVEFKKVYNLHHGKLNRKYNECMREVYRNIAIETIKALLHDDKSLR